MRDPEKDYEVPIIEASLSLRRLAARAHYTTACAIRTTRRHLASRPGSHGDSLDPGPGPCTVHGTFRLKDGMTTFNPQTGAAQGEILVDVTSGESGNPSRDSRMHKAVLESEKYPQAIFHPTRVTGALKAGATQTITVEGTLTIHGADHPLKLEIKVQVDGHDAVATMQFSVPYVAWGMKDPSSTLLRVGKEAAVDVVAKGQVDGIL